jgi:SAM-dependent methyltransferase
VNHIDVTSFEEKYQQHGDPWGFSSSPYEPRRYELTVAALPRRRYQRAFEPGCAIGELTFRLAARCTSLLAMDAAPTAVRAARARCATVPGVDVVVGEVPADWPGGHFDLVVLSELGYYFDVPELVALRDRAVGCLERGGTLLAVHWRGHSADHLLHGDEVHGHLAAGAKLLEHVGRYVEASFRLDIWERA